MIKEIITTFLAGFFLHLATTSKENRQKHLVNFQTGMGYIDNILRSRPAKFAIRTLIVLLILASAVLGTLICTINILNNKPLLLSLIAPVLSVGAVLPLASLVYKQSFE